MSGNDQKKAQNESSEEILSCGTSLTISGAESLYQRLKILLEGEAAVVIEAQDVEVVDTAALQLLGAFIQEAASHGVSVKWQAPSAALRASAHRMDMESLLMLEAA